MFDFEEKPMFDHDIFDRQMERARKNFALAWKVWMFGVGLLSLCSLAFVGWVVVRLLMFYRVV